MNIIHRIEVSFPDLAKAMHGIPTEFALGWLQDAAMAETGLSDFGPDSYVEPLQRLCASLNAEADLNPYGRLLVAGVIRNQLGNRLLLQRVRTAQPERLAAPLVAPIIVSGLPRTGTTFLHRLLAADPAHASLPYWQLNRPIPRTPADTPEARIADVNAMINVRCTVTPELDGTHMMRAESPEECLWLTGISGYTRLWWNLAPVYGFMHWYMRVDKTAKYRDYRDTITYLQGEYPGQRFVLKAPDHNDGLAELLDAIPEARVILTHRDMAEQVGSYMSLGRTTRRLAVNRLDTPREAEAVIDMTDVSIEKMAAARARHPGKILDIRYSAMMADPLAAVEQIYGFCDLALPDDRRTEIADHHARNPKGKHGKHDYGLDEFGVDPAWVTARYAGYAAQFLS